MAYTARVSIQINDSNPEISSGEELKAFLFDLLDGEVDSFGVNVIYFEDDEDEAEDE